MLITLMLYTQTIELRENSTIKIYVPFCSGCDRRAPAPRALLRPHLQRHLALHLEHMRGVRVIPVPILPILQLGSKGVGIAGPGGLAHHSTGVLAGAGGAVSRHGVGAAVALTRSKLSERATKDSTLTHTKTGAIKRRFRVKHKTRTEKALPLSTTESKAD